MPISADGVLNVKKNNLVDIVLSLSQDADR